MTEPLPDIYEEIAELAGDYTGPVGFHDDLFEEELRKRYPNLNTGVVEQ